jgi:DNA repair exonuclease SbcCD ATPase subunit
MVVVKYYMISKIVEFQKIKVRNFLSYGDIPIEVEFKNGITFITGYNKDTDSHNGVGKTSLIVESLSFLLFGETYRDINQKLIRNKDSKKSCIVEGWLKVNDRELYIVRSLNPGKLILTVDGDSDNYTKSIPETNKSIMEMLGISKTIFTNTIVMTNRDSMAFLNQKKEVKTKFVEGILGLEAFTEFLKLAKEEYKLAEDNKNRKLFEVTQTQRDLQSDIDYQQREKEKNERNILDLSSKIQSLKSIQPVDNSSRIHELIEENKIIENSLIEKEDKIRRGNEKKYGMEADKNEKQKILTKLKGTLTECPSCKRPFEEHNRESIENEKKGLTEEINTLVEGISRLNNGISKVANDVSSGKKTISENNRTVQILNLEQQKFVKSQTEIESLENELIKLQNFTNPFKEKIDETQKKLTILQLEEKELSNKARLANLIKEGASPTGIKALLIKKIINSLNDRINHYLIRLNSPFRVYFDEFFEETFKSVNGEDYSYGSLSGGEAKRVDFAMLFAFRDIRRLQSNVHVNLTVMDELFDSALDGSGMQAILEVLKENSDECYLIVTHRASNVELFDCNIIDLIKENGITRLNN